MKLYQLLVLPILGCTLLSAQNTYEHADLIHRYYQGYINKDADAIAAARGGEMDCIELDSVIIVAAAIQSIDIPPLRPMYINFTMLESDRVYNVNVSLSNGKKYRAVHVLREVNGTWIIIRNYIIQDESNCDLSPSCMEMQDTYFLPYGLEGYDTDYSTPEKSMKMFYDGYINGDRDKIHKFFAGNDKYTGVFQKQDALTYRIVSKKYICDSTEVTILVEDTIPAYVGERMYWLKKFREMWFCIGYYMPGTD